MHVYDLAERELIQSITLPSEMISEARALVEAGTSEQAAKAAEGGGSRESRRPPLPPPPPPPPFSAWVHVSACGPHLVAIGLGCALLQLAPSSGSWLELEAAWLRKLSARPWDATLVDQHLTRAGLGGSGGVDGSNADEDTTGSGGCSSSSSSGGGSGGMTPQDISDPHAEGVVGKDRPMFHTHSGGAAPAASRFGAHPLARAVSRLAHSFSRDGPKLAAEGSSSGVGLLAGGLGGGLAEGLRMMPGGLRMMPGGLRVGGGGALITEEGCAAACSLARHGVTRLALEALMLFPQLAASSAEDGEIAHGAAGVELVSMVERRGYGVVRKTLVELQMRVAPQPTRRYQQQLRLLSRLTPGHLGLPSAFSAGSSPPSASAASAASSISSSSSSSSTSSSTTTSSSAAAAPGGKKPYAEAIHRLQQLPFAGTPERGLRCLVDVCHRVARCAEQSGAPPPSADELVPPHLICLRGLARGLSARGTLSTAGPRHRHAARRRERLLPRDISGGTALAVTAQVGRAPIPKGGRSGGPGGGRCGDRWGSGR